MTNHEKVNLANSLVPQLVGSDRTPEDVKEVLEITKRILEVEWGFISQDPPE